MVKQVPVVQLDPQEHILLLERPLRLHTVLSGGQVYAVRKGMNAEAESILRDTGFLKE